jgi:outer membrane protein assembly factor BamB
MKAFSYVALFAALVAAVFVLPGNLTRARANDVDLPALLAEADKTPEPPPEKPTEPEDITEQVKQYNSGEYAVPPGDFRQGHVTPRTIEGDALKKTENGYRVQLRSKAPIATPAVYDGAVYVTGGFRSKEFYAFDAKTGRLKWAVDLDDDGPSAAVARDGVVIFNTESCTIFGLDAATGRQLWSWWLGDPLMSTPTIANGKVFTSYPAAGRHSGINVQQTPQANAKVNAAPQPAENKEPAKKAPPASHVLAAFDLKTGKILWQRWLDSDVMSAPVASGEELYVATFAGTLYKFRQADGEILSAKRVRATSAPVVVGSEIYYSRRVDEQGSGKVEEATVTAKRQSGQEVAQTNRKTAPYLNGAVQSKADYKAQGGELDAANGFASGAPASANAQAAFENVGQNNVSTLQAYQGSRVLRYGAQNFSVMGDEIVCNDAVSGKTVWSHKLSGDLEKEGGFIGTPPAAAGGSIFVGTLNGKVLRIDPATGKPQKVYDVGAPIRSQPVVEGGIIFVGTQDGKLVAIDTQDPTLTGWSMWGGDAAHTGYRTEAK